MLQNYTYKLLTLYAIIIATAFMLNTKVQVAYINLSMYNAYNEEQYSFIYDFLKKFIFSFL
jgi:hypothetical protein